MSKLDIVPLAQWGFFSPGRLNLIAGPCSAETLEQVLRTAAMLKSSGVGVFRAGIWKPRTHPGCFEGLGEEALGYLDQVRSIHAMNVACEVASPSHVNACLNHGVDMVWLGARTSANPFLVQEIAEALRGVEIPVLVKNPVNPDVDLWMGAFERLNACGVRKLGAVHRGVSTYRRIRYRNDPAWEMAIEMRSRVPELPMFCDPSHMGGSVEYIRELSQRALDLGFDGLMLEVHCDPQNALSDASQQLDAAQLSALLDLSSGLRVRASDSDNVSYRENIVQLREKIDIIDDNLLSLLSQRMEISARIGMSKKENNISILQTGRWDAVMDRMISRGREAGLSEDFVRSLFTAIHEESVSVQNKILEK